MTANADGSSVTVTLSATSDRDVTVRYATADGNHWNAATAGSDYEARSGQVTIRASQTTATVVVLVLADRVGEESETFLVRQVNPTNAFVADGLGVGTVLDDEPRVWIGNATAVTEGNTGAKSVTFIVWLSDAADAPVTVEYATADPSQDDESWYWPYWVLATAG